MSADRKDAAYLMFSEKDNSHLKDFEKRLGIDNIYSLAIATREDPSANLGIRVYNNKLYSGNYIGICRLKYRDGSGRIRNVSCEGKEVVLKIEPRFKVSVPDMLRFVSKDEEFEKYLAPQTNDNSEKDAQDTISNELFCFSEDDDPIFVGNAEQSSSIITAANFLCTLKALCLRPLMGRMLTKEENLVGKVKGKILIPKNIRMNTIRGRDDRIYCRYLQYSEDIPENQVLKAALKKATAVLNSYFKSTGIAKNTFMEMAGYCNNSLSHISLTKVSRQELAQIKPTGCYAYYKPVINLARMVLDEISADAAGQVKFTGYVVPYAVSMNRLFEMYARTYIKEYLRNENSEWSMVPYDQTTNVLSPKPNNDKYYIGGTVKPDVILYSPGKDKYNPEGNGYKYTVLDVKYKRPEKHHARDDRLQILAYALMYNCDKVGIIFPPNDDNSTNEENAAFETSNINIQGGALRTYIQVKLPIKSLDRDANP